jgi:hypothetical protein
METSTQPPALLPLGYKQLYHNIRKVLSFISKGKVKAIPVKAWAGPYGSRRLTLPDITIGT